MFSELVMFARYAAGLPRYLGSTITRPQAQSRIRRSLAARQENFLKVIRRGVFGNPRSPYLRLLKHASIELGDIEGWTNQDGIEATLSKLYDAGVYITGEEFKGRRPVRRGKLEFPVSPRDFDNLLLERHYEAQTSGSRGVPRRIIIDLDLLVQESCYLHQFMDGFDLWDRPVAAWRSVPPVSSGMKIMLRHARIGRSVRQWFTRNRFAFSLEDLPFFIFTAYTIFAGRLMGRTIPQPIYTPRQEVNRVVNWLAEQASRGAPAMCDSNASAAVHLCLAAKQRGVNIAGTFFRTGGEPLTPAKVAAITAVGARVACHYSMAEIGHIGIGCADPSDIDDVHVLLDKVAVIQRSKSIGDSGIAVDALIYTTVLPSCPTIMLNVESGDYGILEDRACNCPFNALGFKTHLRKIRSYEKLTSEGVTFLGTELLRLVEEVLPARFGGSSLDYQLVEHEESGLPRVSVLIDPRLGQVNDADVIDAVRRTLSDCRGGAIMMEQWDQAKLLRVIRRSPYATQSAKILPLHILPKS